MRSKTKEREEARRLRSTQGLAIKRIAGVLQVSPASVHAWTRDIVLTPEQVRRNRARPCRPSGPEVVQTRAAAWVQRSRERRAAYQAEGRRRAHEADPLHLAGCMLYWAEGAKSRNSIRLANSDPALMRLFSGFVRTCLGVQDSAMRVSLNFYTSGDRSVEAVERYWLEVLGLPPSCLGKHSVNCRPTSSSGSKPHKLPYGTCTLTVHSTRLVQHIYGAIQEYAGFDEPRWIG